MLAHLNADELALLHHIEEGSPIGSSLSPVLIQNFAKAQHPQTSHRVNILKAWGVEFDGLDVLEIGCGQGDASVVLTSAVEGGSVTAWDPASPDYGSPLTVGQAQANLISKPQLKGLTFRLGGPLADLLHIDYDVAVLLHCLYYFPTSETISDTFSALHPRVNTLCIAEYALRSSIPSQHPHVLAVLAQQALAKIQPLGESQSNIQTVLSPRAITALAKDAGWVLDSERFITPDTALQDGRWEVGTVCSPRWMEDVDEALNQAGDEPSRHRDWLSAAYDATIASVEMLTAEHTTKGDLMQKVRTMDVWCGVFKRGMAA